MNSDNILVSILLISYNQKEYIIEALDSIKAQTYRRIELITSDDCSTDGTFEKINEWFRENGQRFSGYRIMKTEKNSGVTVSCDLAARAANGEWLKIMAGDDILPSDSIEKSVAFLKNNANDGIICSKYLHFCETNNGKEVVGMAPTPFVEKMLRKPVEKQYHDMLFYNVMYPTYLVSKRLMEEVGYFETDFPEIEDYPLALKITRSGHRVIYTDKFIGYYHRVGIDSISGTTKGYMNESAFKLGGKLDRQNKKFVVPYISKWHFIYYWHYYVDKLRRYVIISVFRNKKNHITHFVSSCLVFIDPIELRKKIINSMYRKNSKSIKGELIR